MQAPGGIARAIEVLRSRGLAERLGRLGVLDAGDLRLQEPSGTRGPSGLLNEAALGELVEATRAQARGAREHGDRLLLIGGDCPVMLGALAGLRDHADARPGLLMLDGHEDAWLPAQSPTGEASDSELAIALGLVSDRLPAPLDNLVPLLEPADVALLGPRDRADIDAAGARSVEGHVALFLSGEETSRADSPAATALRALETPDFWLHIDLDVLATDAFGAADYLQPGGLTWSELDAIAGTAVGGLSLQRCERGHLQPRTRSRSARGGSGDRVLVPTVGGRMIARTWKGTVRRADAEKYADYIRETGFGEYGQTPGNRGAWMLRRDEGDRTEFITLSLWESEDAIRAFAGDDIEAAVLYPEDELYLIDGESTVTHHQVVDQL